MTVAAGSVCTFAGSAFPDDAPGTRAKTSNKCRVTVLRRILSDGSDGNARLCPLFKDNQELTVESPWRKPEVFCDEGWADIQPCIRSVGDGKSDESVCGCNGPSPVFFKIERLKS